MAEKEKLLKEVVGIITEELTRDAVHKNRKKELVYTMSGA